MHRHAQKLGEDMVVLFYTDFKERDRAFERLSVPGAAYLANPDQKEHNPELYQAIQDLDLPLIAKFAKLKVKDLIGLLEVSKRTYYVWCENGIPKSRREQVKHQLVNTLL